MSAWFQNVPIRRKLILMLMTICVAGMLLMRVTSFIHEYVTFRSAMQRQLSVLAKVIADNSTGALAFGSSADADETLSALHAEPNVVAAALYDRNGKLFARYPVTRDESLLPGAPAKDGFEFSPSRLAGFEPVTQKDKRLGTLYLELDSGTILAAWLRGSFGIALAVMLVATVVAYLLATALQRYISHPILALADAAKRVTEHRDYSVRAQKLGRDELGLLTDAFNRMLAQIQEHDLIVRQNERRFRALIERSSDSVSLIDAANNILYVSPAVTNVEGYRPDELIGRNGTENTHPDDLPMLRELVGQLMAHPGQPVPVLWRRRHKSGQWLWLEGVATNLLGDSAIGAIVTNYRDVTERKRAEAEITRLNQDLERRVVERTAELAVAHDHLRREQARLKFIFDTMPVGLSFTVTPPEGNVTRLLNDTHLRICGLTREQVRTQADFHRISHPADRERQDALVRELEAGRIESFTLDKRYVRPDGQIIWVILSAQRRTLDDGTREDLSVILDITERKTTEETLRLTNQKLENQSAQLAAANAELEAFSYSVSHDLRAPLRHVDGFANLLTKRAAAQLDAQSLRYVSTISNAAKQMGRLIDDLLGFSRMSRTALRVAEVDQNALIAAIIAEGHYAQNAPTLTWDIGALPAVNADAAMLRQVWANLIENAVKYSGKNPQPAVALGCDAAHSDKMELVFFVRDNGVGFDMAYADKLFGVFQRLHSPAEFEGTGIGLANVRRIILRHGGRTWAEGRVGEGATFYFSLPAIPTTS